MEKILKIHGGMPHEFLVIVSLGGESHISSLVVLLIPRNYKDAIFLPELIKVFIKYSLRLVAVNIL